MKSKDCGTMDLVREKERERVSGAVSTLPRSRCLFRTFFQKKRNGNGTGKFSIEMILIT